MALIFLYLLYFIFIIGYVLAYFFIVYHIIKYSINSSLNKTITPIFVIISTLLLFSNIILFFNVSWGELLNKLTAIPPGTETNSINKKY